MPQLLPAMVIPVVAFKTVREFARELSGLYAYNLFGHRPTVGWRLRLEPPAAVDLSQLTEVQLLFDTLTLA